jgi:hypothetical protein
LGPLGLMRTQKFPDCQRFSGPGDFRGLRGFFPPKVPGPPDVAESPSLTGPNGFARPPGVPRLTVGNELQRVPGSLGVFKDLGPPGAPRSLRAPGLLGPPGVPVTPGAGPKTGNQGPYTESSRGPPPLSRDGH